MNPSSATTRPIASGGGNLAANNFSFPVVTRVPARNQLAVRPQTAPCAAAAVRSHLKRILELRKAESGPWLVVNEFGDSRIPVRAATPGPSAVASFHCSRAPGYGSAIRNPLRYQTAPGCA